MQALVSTLYQNAVLLLAMMAVVDIATSRYSMHTSRPRQVLAGLILGGLCIALMITSFDLETGIIFDTRSVLLSLSGLFLGTIPTVFAMGTAAAYRLWLGGAGTWTGVSVILTAGAIGILWRHYRTGQLKDISITELYGFGIAVHLAKLALMFTLPGEAKQRVLGEIWLPVLLIYPIATIALGWLFANRLRRGIVAASLATSEKQYRSVFEAANVGKALIAPTGELHVNRSFCDMLGYRPKELSDKALQDLVPPEEIGPINKNLSSLLQGKQNTVRVETLYLHKNGSRVWVDFSVTLLRDSDDKPLHFIGTFVDITDRKRAEELQKKSESRFRVAQELAPDGFTILRPVRNENSEINDFIWEYENPAIALINSTDPKEVIGKQLLHLFPDHRDSQLFQAYLEVANTGETRVIEEVFIEDIIAKPIWLRLVIVSMGSEIAIHSQDITDRKRSDAEIHRLAYYDTLTHLPNRRLFQDRLGQAMAGSRRSGHHGALIFLDIDNFKILNDTRGHDAGDQLLVEIGQRIRAGGREADTVARLGGDEFVMMLEDLSEKNEDAAVQALQIAEKIHADLTSPYDVDGSKYHCSASIGITLFKGHDESAESLLKQADLAMYKAKDAGRNTLRFFDPAMQTALDESTALETDLRLAVDSDQLFVHYQPQVDNQGQVLGAEILLRWLHPERGMISPAEFIPLAEATGLILPIGRWVLQVACRQLASWSENPATQNLKLAVNVSALEFRKAGFVDQMTAVIKETGTYPTRLRLELTESMLLDDVGGSLEKMMALQKLGIGFALDDFGTGYSSLAYLTRLPLDTLKIDKSFVSKLPGSHNDAVIAQAIISMARSLGLDVIAEGVETEAQRDFLASHQCNVYQGYLLSRAVPLEEFERFCVSHGAN